MSNLIKKFMFKSLTWLLVSLTFLVGCSPIVKTVGSIPGEIEAKIRQIKDFPEINQSPNLKITIHGHKDPRLELKFGVVFGTENKECQVPHISAGHISQSFFDWTIAKEGDTDFESILILDKYISGRCEWESGEYVYVTATMPQGKKTGEPNENRPILFRVVDIPIDWVHEMRFSCKLPADAAKETVFCTRVGGQYLTIPRKSGEIDVIFNLN